MMTGRDENFKRNKPDESYVKSNMSDIQFDRHTNMQSSIKSTGDVIKHKRFAAQTVNEDNESDIDAYYTDKNNFRENDNQSTDICNRSKHKYRKQSYKHYANNVNTIQDKYNISETVQNNKEHFEKKQDINFEETAAERESNIAFNRFEKKAQRAKDKALEAEKKLPKKKKIKKQRLYDEKKQKPKTRLQFENEVKPQTDLYHRSPIKSGYTAVGYTIKNKIHGEIAEVEQENTAVEAAHKTEQRAESLTRYSLRTAKYIEGQKKAAPYKKASRLKQKAEKAEVKAAYEKLLAENPQLSKSALQKFKLKQQIKRGYQKQKNVEQRTKGLKKTARNSQRAISQFMNLVGRNKTILFFVLLIILLVGLLGISLSSCSIMGANGFYSIMVSSYFADDEDIYAAENYYVSLEKSLQSKIDNIEHTYPNYDEYKYNLAQIGHNPYELISYLTAVYQDFRFNDIKPNLDVLFNSQYYLRITETVKHKTDDEGNSYIYKILNVTLTNSGFTQTLNTEQLELYNIYLESKGNRDYLFADDIYSNITTNPYEDYKIPSEALTDETFRKLINEAEKYLGYPYVWGGSSPSTSFDCSGFVCWVFRKTGVYPLSRTTAQGIFNQCSTVKPADAQPGDIIFFTGTYDSVSPVSHVGIYVGNGMMIHCGNPIQYESVNSKYWRKHFYAYGRLGGR